MDQFQLNCFARRKIVPSTQLKNETEDDEMNQVTPDSIRSDDDESECASGTTNEDSSGDSPYYRLQRE